jgi:hypothetical protein
VSDNHLVSNSGQTSLAENCEAPLLSRRNAAIRIFGLDAGDWSMLLLGIALAGVLLMFF